MLSYYVYYVVSHIFKRTDASPKVRASKKVSKHVFAHTSSRLGRDKNNDTRIKSKLYQLTLCETNLLQCVYVHGKINLGAKSPN